MRIGTVAAIAALAITAGSIGSVIASATSARAQSDPPLVYICPSLQGQTTNCANDQEFEVFNTYGDPIYSVGEFGGDGVFAGNRSIYAPGNLTNPALVESYTTPASYGSTTCVAPSTWIEPHGIWYCDSAGKWIKDLSIP